MDRYVIEETIKANDKNETYKGDTSIYTYGKGYSVLAIGGDHTRWTGMGFNHTLWMAKEEGYFRKQDAVRIAKKYMAEFAEKYWDLVEMKVIAIHYGRDCSHHETTVWKETF